MGRRCREKVFRRIRAEDRRMSITVKRLKSCQRLLDICVEDLPADLEDTDLKELFLYIAKFSGYGPNHGSVLFVKGEQYMLLHMPKWTLDDMEDPEEILEPYYMGVLRKALEGFHAERGERLGRSTGIL